MAGVWTFKYIHDVEYILSRLALYAHALTWQVMEHMTTLMELPMWLSITMATLSGELQNTWQVSWFRTPACGALSRSGVYVCISEGVCSLDYSSVLRLHWYTKVLWSLFCTHRHTKIKSFFSGSRCYITFLLYLCRATEEKRGTKGGRGQTAHQSFLRCQDENDESHITSVFFNLLATCLYLLRLLINHTNCHMHRPLSEWCWTYSSPKNTCMFMQFVHL